MVQPHQYRTLSISALRANSARDRVGWCCFWIRATGKNRTLHLARRNSPGISGHYLIRVTQGWGRGNMKREEEREGERESFYLLVHSSDGQKMLRPRRIQSWAKLETRRFVWLSHMGAEAQMLGLSSAAFPRLLEGSWIGSGTTETQTGDNIGWWFHSPVSELKKKKVNLCDSYSKNFY